MAEGTQKVRTREPNRSLLSVLLQQQLVSLERVAQDGTRVRASASAPSFRRAASLQACWEQAALHLKAVLAQQDAPDRTRCGQRHSARTPPTAWAAVKPPWPGPRFLIE